MTRRILSWNCRRAGTDRHAAWEYFMELAPDIAVLQEVTGIPQYIRDKYEVGHTLDAWRGATAISVRDARPWHYR